jgi:hypothetical protein
MNTACMGSSSPSKSMSPSNESTCRPKALRRTVMSIAPSGTASRPGTPASVIEVASRIIPAQDP